MQKYIVYFIYKLETYWRVLLFGLLLFLVIAFFSGSTTLPDMVYFTFLDADPDRGAVVLDKDPFDATLSKIVYLDQGWKASDRKSTRLNSSHIPLSRMPSSA